MEPVLTVIAASAGLIALGAALYNSRTRKEKEVAERTSEVRQRAKERAHQRAFADTVPAPIDPWAVSVAVSTALSVTETSALVNELTPEQDEVIAKIFREAGIDIVQPPPVVFVNTMPEDVWANARD